ncbi:MAG: hypothetical protein ACLGG8_10900 [Gammaproteobacteria bacterium]
MRIAIWLVTALLATLWTGLAMASVSLTGWLLSVAGSAPTGELAGMVGQWPVPAWLAPWVDAAWLQAAQASLVELVRWLGEVMPSAGSLMAWISPLVWVLWALGMFGLLLVAGLLHWLTGRRTPPVSSALRT